MSSNQEPLEIRYSGVIDRQQYEEAIKEHYMPSIWGQRLRLWGGLLLVGFAIAAVSFRPDLWFYGLGVIIFVGLINTHLWLPQLITSQQWKQNPALLETIRGRITDTMISFFDQNNEEELPWTQIAFYRQASQAILLYQNKAAFSIITRSLFDSEIDWLRFLDAVSHKVQRFDSIKTDGRTRMRRIAIGVFVIVLIVLAIITLQNRGN